MSGTKNNLQTITLQSAADFSTTGQYRFCTVNASGQAALASSGGLNYGVVLGNPDAAGKSVAVGVSGVSLLELGGTVTAGDQVQSGASGVGTSGSTNSRAVALESGVSGDIISVLLV